MIELVIGRTWKARLDGLQPVKDWEVGDPIGEDMKPERIGGDHSETYYRYTTRGLRFTNPIPGSTSEVEIEWIAFDVPHDEWTQDIDGVKLAPTEAFVMFKGDEYAVYMKVTECWYLDEQDLGPAPKGVMIEGGEWIEVDETQAYVRLEEAENKGYSDEEAVDRGDIIEED